MNKWTDRTKERMRSLGMTQEVLARRLGVTRGAIGHYLSGRREPSLEQLSHLASILKTDPAWLQFGASDKTSSSRKTQSEQHLEAQGIPLLNWDEVSSFQQGKIKRDKERKYLSLVFKNKLDLFALKINNDAMTATYGNIKSFPSGDIIIVDPHKKAGHNDYVIAQLQHSKETTFKQYVIDGGTGYLKPLNPQYPTQKTDKTTHISGVVVAHLDLFFSET